ncbi:MAG: lipid-binding SYLF domain-containing protein [Acidobacteriales bacterium]|nr:lipid-binding SYLF domain-containing protein [Terriglobales bacterium]
MKRLLAVGLALGFGCVAASAQQSPADAQRDETVHHNSETAKMAERLDKAAIIIEELSNTPDKGIPDEIVAKARCVAVVPGLKKGAIGIGGQYGQGVASCRNAGRWSAPAPIRMAGGSWGLQLGGSSTDIVMVAVNQKGMQDLLSAKFKIGAGAAAAAGPVGRHANAGTDWKLDSELLTYSRSKGLFAGISLDGTEVSQNDDDTAALYGHLVPFRTILSGSTPVPADARRFERALTSYFNRVKEEKAGQ